MTFTVVRVPCLLQNSQFWRIAWDTYLQRAHEPDIRGSTGTAREKLRLLAYQVKRGLADEASDPSC